ncbi:hypothetical protein GCM10009555_020740 [Acrocarpospora macrocephala]|uniref:Uncharacterized protein n=1 Tax=Acrocarpospora macrocephala TaxID=150177 RepID=A0A5M3WGV1_9ACTN|nr:hypothetical protein Amac_015210 [Acrocarpospora macrocephala]
MQFWPFHRHRWREIERIGTVATSWCPCGKTKTRVGKVVPERSRKVLPASPGSHDHDPARSIVWDLIVRDVEDVRGREPESPVI